MPNPLVQRSSLFLSNHIQLYKPVSAGRAGVILLADARVHPATGALRAPGTERDPREEPPRHYNGVLEPKLTLAAARCRLLIVPSLLAEKGRVVEMLCVCKFTLESSNS